jgi:hypothetical protein
MSSIYQPEPNHGGAEIAFIVAGRKRQRLDCLTGHIVRRRARATTQTELRCYRAAGTSKERLRRICGSAAQIGVTVATGVFGAMMSVELVNEGPVTILLDSDKTFWTAAHTKTRRTFRRVS